MEAMASRRAQGARAQGATGTRGRLGQLWQLPLLLVSLGLFAYAAKLFIDPRSGPTLEQRIEQAAATLKNDRPEAALEQLRGLRDSGKLAKAGKESERIGRPPASADARVHLLQAQAIDALQKQKKLDEPVRHAEIIQHLKDAMAGGVKPDAAIERRLGESYEALDRPKDALEHYRKAIELDPEKAPAVQRKVIDLQLARDDTAAAEAALDEYLKDPRLGENERTWAVGEQSRLLVDRGDFEKAKELLAGASRTTDPVAQGQMDYRLGYCEWKLGNAAEAERLLRAARDLLRTQHPLDADAAYLLGRILQDRGQPRDALSFYEEVIVSHPDSAVALPARIGRGVCRIAAGEDEPGLVDLHEVVRDVDNKEKPSRAKFKDDVVAALNTAATALAQHGNYKGALELLESELKLVPDPAVPAEFYGQVASACEKYADQLDKAAASAPTDAKRLDLGREARRNRVRAADASVTYALKLTASNDKAHAEALWRGIDLYDRAGDLPRAISALELYVAERPGDPTTPDALLRLGRMYQVAGNFDKAIAAYQKIKFGYPQTLAASRSGVPLAQAYVAKGPEFYARAEAALKATLDSPLITPAAEDFKDALFERAQLYYRTGRYEEAVGRFNEITDRYPAEGRMGQILFLMADSYRKSAGLLKEGKGMKSAAAAGGNAGNAGNAATAPAGGGTGVAAGTSAAQNPAQNPAGVASQLAAQAEAATQRRDRLIQARRLFDRVVEQFRTAAPVRDVDKLYLKLAHFYRADCVYDLGGYEEAIRLYDAAALRYQDDPSALTAYVQIVNAYCALGRTEEARAANERARWLLRRMPPEAFKDGTFSVPKEYWENWLKWAGDAGMW